MASNNPTPTASLQTTLGELANMAIKQRNSKQIVRFDLGQGREIAFAVFVEDSNGYLGTLQAYENGRDDYANKVANAVADDIRKNGLPDPSNPKPFNIVKSSDGETLLPPPDES